MSRAPMLALFALVGACSRGSAGDSVASAAPPAPGVASAAPAARTPDAAAPSAAAPAAPAAHEIAGLHRTTAGEWRARLRDGREAAAIFGTLASPRAARGPASVARLADVVAPGVVSETLFRAVPLRELTAAVEGAVARAHLEREVRVLSDGTVEVALTVRPARGKPVDLANVTPGSVAWSWESALVSRGAVAADRVGTLAAYQKLLAVDYLAANLARRWAVVLEEGSLTAWEGNDAFSGTGVPGSVTDAFARLSRSLTFSRSLLEGLRRLDAAAIEEASRGLRPGDRSFTPRQAAEVGERRDALVATIEQRRARRGEAALGLP